MTHPIAQTMRRGRDRRYAGCHLGLQVDNGADADWVTIGALTEDRARLRALLAGIGRDVGSGRRDVQGSVFLEAYAWRLVLPLAGALVAEQRVAAPTTHEVTLRPTDGRSADLRLVPCRFSVLPQDAATSHRDATPTRTPAMLAGLFERALIGHFEVIVNALNGVTGRSERALWRTIGDRTATAALYAGHACNDLQAGEQLGHQVLRGAPPLRITPAYATIPVQDSTARVHLRRGCCLWWRTAAATYCVTCPLKHQEKGPSQSRL